MYTLKSVAQRSTTLGAAVALLAATIMPASAAFADSLNPLTERSLMLSSSAPGYKDTDGSGNSNSSPNAISENYAPAGSGPNGKKTGENFTFKVSSEANVKGFSLQYCTTAAGWCRAPGDNTGDADPNNDGTQTDSTRQANEDDDTDPEDIIEGGHSNETSDLDFVGNFAQAASGAAPTAGQFQIYVEGAPITYSTAWALSAVNVEDHQYAGSGAQAGTLTGKKNYITLTNADGIDLDILDEVQIVFKASESVYITNPGSGSFFVKINTYNSNSSLIGSHNDTTRTDNTDSPSHTVIDGGVTVANVMTDSIHITTKVLETMAFSVGTNNRDTVELTGGDSHGTCDAIQQLNNNRLNLGNPDAEFSLETGKAWAVNSYWRLSSNSSGGATVYYSGNTLANTVGDEISDMPAEVASLPGTEQFGLGFVDANEDTKSSSFAAAVAAPDSRFKNPTSFPFVTLQDQLSDPDFPAGQLASEDYDQATGTIDNGAGGAGQARFKFLKSSLTVPEPIAKQNTEVISCATAKMRYVANIGADTPAGVYTTKINYLAAPQY